MTCLYFVSISGLSANKIMFYYWSRMNGIKMNLWRWCRVSMRSFIIEFDMLLFVGRSIEEEGKRNIVLLNSITTSDCIHWLTGENAGALHRRSRWPNICLPVDDRKNGIYGFRRFERFPTPANLIHSSSTTSAAHVIVWNWNGKKSIKQK